MGSNGYKTGRFAYNGQRPLQLAGPGQLPGPNKSTSGRFARFTNSTGGTRLPDGA